MALRIAFFDAKSYDIESFNAVNKDYNFDIRYYQERLSISTVPLAKGADVVCIFVNAECDAKVIDELVNNGVKLVALRCAGFNNVDLKAAEGRIRVTRVPAYSPHAVAEYAVSLMLSLNRKIVKVTLLYTDCWALTCMERLPVSSEWGVLQKNSSRSCMVSV